MLNLVKTLSFVVENGRRVVKFLRYGKNDTRTAIQSAPAGIDAGPIKNLVAVYARTEKKGNPVIIGYLNKNAISKPGELRFYSQDSDGNELVYLYLNENGIIELGGNTDFAVKYNELKTAFDQLKSDFNNLVTVYNSHIHTAPSGPTSTTPSTGTSSAADMTSSKVDNVKLG